MVFARVFAFKVFYARMICGNGKRRRLKRHCAAHRNILSVLQKAYVKLIYMYLIFYDLDSLAQNAVNIQCFGNTVAVLLYAAALPLFIREDRREQLAECGYGDKQYDSEEQERFDLGVSEVAANFSEQLNRFLEKQRGNADAHRSRHEHEYAA